jgi:hypothetical protein
MASSPPPCYLLGSRCLLLYVLAIFCLVVGISHHLPPPQIHRMMQTLPHTPATKAMMTQLTTTQMRSDADDDSDVDADNNDTLQMKEDNADDGQ